jgi:hypothetical protein
MPVAITRRPISANAHCHDWRNPAWVRERDRIALTATMVGQTLVSVTSCPDSGNSLANRLFPDDTLPINKVISGAGKTLLHAVRFRAKCAEGFCSSPLPGVSVFAPTATTSQHEQTSGLKAWATGICALPPVRAWRNSIEPKTRRPE